MKLKAFLRIVFESVSAGTVAPWVAEAFGSFFVSGVLAVSSSVS